MSIENRIEETIKVSITKFFEGKDVKVEHVLDLIFPKERRIRSLIGGLETSLGTRVWEPIAKLFAEENGFTVKNEKEFNGRVPVIPDFVRHAISDFEAQKQADPSLKIEDFFQEIKEEIKKRNYVVEAWQSIPKGEGADVWIEKEGKEYLIDIKTTQINAGSGPKFAKNQLNWYAYRALAGANDVKCLLAFPFNPHTGKDFWAREGGKASPLIPADEAVVADEFWGFLLGRESSTDLIFRCFKSLGDKGFGEQFAHIFEARGKQD